MNISQVGLDVKSEVVVTFIPTVGSVLSALVGIFSLVLSVRAIKVSHKLTTGRAVGALLLPVLFVVLLAICVTSVLLLLGPVVGEVFEEIIHTI